MSVASRAAVRQEAVRQQARPIRATFKNHRLTVVGASSAERIKIVRRSSTFVVRVNGRDTRVDGAPDVRDIRRVLVRARGGDDVVKVVEKGGSFAQVALQGGGGEDRLVGGKGKTTLLGKRGADKLVGGDGPTLLDGGEADDVLEGGAGASQLVGNAGNDTITGGTGTNAAKGGDGNDSITGGAGTNDLVGGSGDDLIVGGTGANRLYGGVNNDVLRGGRGAGSLSGGDGNDTLTGGPGTDQLVGDGGDDQLFQSPGSDTLAGADGDDRYVLDADNPGGSVEINEPAGGGIDTMALDATTTTGVQVDLGAAAPQALSSSLTVRFGPNTVERIVGGSLDDVLTGTTAANQFTGGPGADTFRHHGPGDGIDVVTDMAPSAGDRVSFVAGGVTGPQLTLDASGTRLRDVASGTYGFNFPASVFSSSAPVYGTAGPAAGRLVAWSGLGGYTLDNGADSLITSNSATGAVLTGGAGKDRIEDVSPNGNTLVGAEGDDLLAGGAGADTFRYSGAGFIGNDAIIDFAGGDLVNLTDGATVQSGYGTTTVAIANGSTVLGTITAANGRVWSSADFS